MTLSTSIEHPMAQLVRNIQAGSEQAEADLITKFSRPISLVLRQQARNAHDVDDLFQETFRIALEKIRNGDLREPEKLNGFLVSTARYTAIDFYRKEHKHQNQDLIVPENVEPVANPLMVLLTREKCEQLRKLIPELKSERDRDILFRFYIAEEDKASICQALNITPMHFSRVIHRAKKRLKQVLLKHQIFQ